MDESYFQLFVIGVAAVWFISRDWPMILEYYLQCKEEMPEHERIVIRHAITSSEEKPPAIENRQIVFVTTRHVTRLDSPKGLFEKEEKFPTIH